MKKAHYVPLMYFKKPPEDSLDMSEDGQQLPKGQPREDMNPAGVYPELYVLTGVESYHARGKTEEYPLPIHDPRDVPRYS